MTETVADRPATDNPTRLEVLRAFLICSGGNVELYDVLARLTKDRPWPDGLVRVHDGAVCALCKKSARFFGYDTADAMIGEPLGKQDGTVRRAAYDGDTIVAVWAA